MKQIYIIYSLILCSILPSRAQLNVEHNGLRIGDVLIKQQVKYKAPGEAKAHSIWDFRELRSIEEEYTLTYESPRLIGDSIYIMGYDRFEKKDLNNAELVVGKEHKTSYYFYQTADSLTQIGYENSAIKQQNPNPITQLIFPLNYGQSINSHYKTKGVYTKVTPISSSGSIFISADAFGLMILPSGDTINPVLRIKVEQTILDTSNDHKSAEKNDQERLLRTYKWYSKGYRYPIFETTETIDLSTDSTLFCTAFFFPPQEHLYLDTDPENLALLDQLWDYSTKDYDYFPEVDLFKESEDQLGLKPRIYPNPVSDILYVDYTLHKATPVTIILSTIDGKIVKNIHKRQAQKGEQHEEIDCSHFISGSYILKIVAGSQAVSGKILKK